jgi:hypothetical protein
MNNKLIFDLAYYNTKDLYNDLKFWYENEGVVQDLKKIFIYKKESQCTYCASFEEAVGFGFYQIMYLDLFLKNEGNLTKCIQEMIDYGVVQNGYFFK